MTEPSSTVRRKTSLSRLPVPGTFMAGRSSVQTKLSSDGPGPEDGSVKSALQSTLCPGAVDKRKTVTAIRGLRNYTTKSGPVKAMPPTVTPIQPDVPDGLFNTLLLYNSIYIANHQACVVILVYFQT